MTTQGVIDEVKLMLTGHLLEMEIDDKTLKLVIKQALRELERYWDETDLITVPFASCIDFSEAKINNESIHVSSVVKVYRATAIGSYDSQTAFVDPLYAQQWSVFSFPGGTTYSLSDYLMNYASWNTLMQIKNTLTTELSFREDRRNNRLYINNYSDIPKMITIEYIPKLKKVSDIKSDYWIDILIRLCVALTKVTLGRIRTRFTQSSSLLTQDGQTILDEGNSELSALRETLNSNSNLIYPID